MSICNEIREELKKRRYKITYDREDENRCIINFRYEPLYRSAKEKFSEEDAKWISTSSVVYDKKKNYIEANLVSPLTKFCELYLEECCINGKEPVNTCRIHVDPEYPRIGLEVKPADLERFRKALDDFMNCTR